MVIAKPEWFKSKKGNFWRLDMPWQGHVYILIMIPLPIVVFFILPNGIIKTLTYMALSVFILIDFVTAYEKSFDEREILQYATAYRNAFWGVMASFFVSVPLLAMYNPILSMYNPNPSMVILVTFTILISSLIFIGTLVINHKKESLK